MAKANGKGCPRCARLEVELAELKQRTANLEAELAAAKKNSSSSSKPPSSDIVSPPPKSRKPGRPKKRRPGGQSGHPRHVRPLFDENELDHIWDWRFPSCPSCDGPLQDADQEPQRLQQIEIEQRPIGIEEHRRIAPWCPHCQRLHIPELPAKLAAAGLFGPRLTALVGWLKGVCHMSVSSIRKYFRDVIGVQISRGMIAKLVHKVSQSLQAPYEELLERLVREDQLNVDETGHKDQGQKLWTWCFRAYLYTVFKISPSRGSDVLIEVLGREFEGILGCDYFSAYHKYMRLNENVTLQFCLAHLIRDYKFLADHPDPRNRTYGRRMLGQFRKLFAIIHRRDQFASPATFQRSLERARDELVWEATMESPHTPEACNLEDRFYQHVESYFRFITTPGVEPTNNLAEQAIRYVAIHRRMTQGTRGETGQRWFERMATVVETCRQQQRSVFEYLCGAVERFFAGDAAPTLIPQLAGTDSS